MATFPPGYAAPDIPIFVPEADAISSFNTGSLAIAAGGEILMNKDESTHAVLQFNKDINGTDFINMGVRSITITDASGAIVPETEILCFTNADNKFDTIATAGIVLKGVEDATFEGGSAIYASNDGVWMPALFVSSINGAEFPAPLISSFTDLFTDTLAASKTVSADAVTTSNLTVSSINGIAYSAYPQCAMYSKNTNQSITTTGNPAFTTLTFQSTIYGHDDLAIAPSTTSQFMVYKKGVYSIDLQVQYANINSGTYSDRTFRLSMGALRAGTNTSLLQANFDFNDNTPTNPAQQLSGNYLLEPGDNLYFQTVSYLSTGSYTISGPTSAPNSHDLNTFWSWNLVKPL